MEELGLSPEQLVAWDRDVAPYISPRLVKKIVRTGTIGESFKAAIKVFYHEGRGSYYSAGAISDYFDYDGFEWLVFMVFMKGGHHGRLRDLASST